MTNKYITVAYRLYSNNEQGAPELIEEAPVEHPFQFISGMGVALDTFEDKVAGLNAGDKFDFELSVEEAYGNYEKERVLDLDKQMFCVDGHFDKDHIFEGAIIPLVNEDGQRFQGLVAGVSEDKVTVDLNHPLAGKALRFEGEVVTSRDATNEELQALIGMLTGEHGCGCGCGDGEEGGCGCGGHGHHHGEGDHECCGGHGHHHGEGEHECCGGHGHHHGEGDHECCGGHGHGHHTPGEGHGDEHCCGNRQADGRCCGKG